MGLLSRRRKSSDEDGDSLVWPIPIWRPRSAPLVPLHRRIINLLSSRPALDLMLSRSPFSPIKREKTSFDVWRSPRGRSTGNRRHSFDVESPREATAECASVQAWHRQSLVDDLERDRPAVSPQIIAPRITITPSLSGLPCGQLNKPTLTADLLDPGSSRARKRNTLSTCSTERTRCGSITGFTSHAGGEDVLATNDLLPGHSGGIAPATMTSTSQYPTLVQLQQMLHCLDLARRLLYAYNRWALATLETARFPLDIVQEYEAMLEAWWAEVSGVLNMLYEQVKSTFKEVEREWAKCSELERSCSKKERKRHLGWEWARKMKLASSRDEISHLSLIRRSASCEINTEQRGPNGSLKRRLSRTEQVDAVPSWVTDLVPEPFTLDELEKDRWRLEDQGRIPTATYTRIYGKDLVRRAQKAYKLSRGEEEVAARSGLRSIDVDERTRLERAQWRLMGRRIELLG